MIKEIAIYGSNIALGCLMGSLILFLVKFKAFPKPIKLLGGYLILSFLTEIIASGLFYLHINNLPLLHLYTLLEFITWSLFYKQLHDNFSLFKEKFWPFVAFICLLLLANSLFIEPVTGFNSNAKTLVQVILMAYAVAYLFSVFGKTDLSDPLQRGLILINFAVIFYYSGSLFIFMFSKLLKNLGTEDSIQHGFWAINAILLVVFQILIFISLWTVAFRKVKS